MTQKTRVKFFFRLWVMKLGEKYVSQPAIFFSSVIKRRMQYLQKKMII